MDLTDAQIGAMVEELLRNDDRRQLILSQLSGLITAHNLIVSRVCGKECEKELPDTKKYDDCFKGCKETLNWIDRNIDSIETIVDKLKKKEEMVSAFGRRKRRSRRRKSRRRRRSRR
jgi:hypothetical protein